MAGVKELLATFAEVAQNPSAQADAYIAQGRRIIGVGPYYVPEEGDPIEALADGWCALRNDSVLYDPHKDHCRSVPALAKESGARGVVLLLAKFCDPEEYDEPITKRECMEAGVPIVAIEIDQSTETYGQARTQLETFVELIG